MNSTSSQRQDSHVGYQTNYFVLFGSLLVGLIAAALIYFFATQFDNQRPGDLSLLPKTKSGEEVKTAGLTGEELQKTVESTMAYTIGSSSPKVVVVEFLDFECPYCRQASSTMSQLALEYANKPVQFMYRHNPLESVHPNALVAAHAAECAKEQNKYKEMHDILFSRQSEINRAAVSRFAQNIDLDLARFEQCVSSEKYAHVIQKDVSDARTLGAFATPTFFINGQKFEGALPSDTMKQIIDYYLSF